MVFPLVDVNGDGGISLAEIQVLYPVPQEYFGIADSNHNGLVSMAELLALAPLLNAIAPGGIMGLIDANGDGVVQYSEISDYATRDQFNALDANNNGVLDCFDVGDAPPPLEGETDLEGELPFEGDPSVEGEWPGEGEPVTEGEIDVDAICWALNMVLTHFEAIDATIDANDDGAVSLEEYNAYSGMFGAVWPALEPLMAVADANKDGKLTRDELMVFTYGCGFSQEGEGFCPLPSDPLPIIQLLFPVVDANGDGGIRAAEIRAIVPEVDLYLEGTGLTLDSAIGMLDSNSDDMLSLAELSPYVSLVPGDFLRYVDANGDGVVQYGEISDYATQDQFAQLDHNGNGVIDCGDLPEAPVEGELPYEGEILPEGEVGGCPLPRDVTGLFNFLLPLVDANGDGGVNRVEILAIVPDAELYLKAMGYSLELVFSILDGNRDGAITADELNVMLPLLCKCGPIDVLSYVDTNGDGVIQPGEVAPYIPADVFASLLDTNGNGMLDCEDAPGAPFEGEAEGESEEGCFSEPVQLIPFSGRFGYGLRGPYSFEGSLTKDYPGSSAWLLMGQFTFNTGGYLVLPPEVSIQESYPEQVSVVIRVIPPPPDVFVPMVIMPMSVTAEISVSAEALFNIRVLTCMDGSVPAEGETEGGYESYCPVATYPNLLLEALWPWVDADGDGLITEEEVEALLPGLAGYGVWDMLDGDDNGALSPDELLPYVSFAVDYLDDNADGVLSLEEVNAYITAAQFIALDVNGNGVLDCEDLGDRPTPPPVDAPCPLPDEPMILIELLWPIIDQNGDGGISLAEIRRMVPQVDQNVFRLADQNGDGLITRNEVYVILPMVVPYTFAPIDVNGNRVIEYGEVAGFIPRTIFREIDANGNGVLDCGDLNGTAGGEGESESTPMLTMHRDVEGNGYYTPGGVLTVVVTLNKVNLDSVNALGLWEELPAGWTVAAVVDSAGAESAPAVGASGRIEFAWLVIPEFPATVIYRVNVPSDASGVVSITGRALYRGETSTELATGIVETLLTGDMGVDFQHTLDFDHDWVISLSEILRVIQLYNMGGYHCEAGTEDGFGPGPGDTSCARHAGDYMTQDWRIDLSELLRMIQLYNAPGHAYHVMTGSEDGFAPGVFTHN